MNQSGRGKGVILCGNQHTLLLASQPQHLLVHLVLPADNDTGRVPLQGNHLTFPDISHNDKIVLLDLPAHGVTVSGSHHHFTFGKAGMGIAALQCPLNRLHNILILCPRPGKDPVIQDIHIGVSDIAVGNQTFQMPVLIDYRHGYHV